MRQPSPSLKRQQLAFTLIELMVTISLLGILIAIALPNLRDFVVGNRLSSNVNSFIGILNYARSEAIVRNQQVVVCAKRNGNIGCELTDDDWGKYEIQIFVDVDGSNNRNSGDELLKTIAAVDTSGTQFVFKKQTGPNVIGFQSGGYGTNLFRFDINVKDSNVAYEAKYGRTLCISRPGRTRVIPLSSSPCAA